MLQIRIGDSNHEYFIECIGDVIKMFKKNIFSLVLIATIAISGAGLYALQQPVVAPSNINIPIKMSYMNAGGNNYINLDTILNKYGFTQNTNAEIMNGIVSVLSDKKYGLDGVSINKDSKDVNYLVIRSNKAQHLNFTDQVAFTITDTVRTNYFLDFDCLFTPIETQINLSSSTPGEINENTIINGTVKAVNYYDKDEYVQSANFTGSMETNVTAIDNPNQFKRNYNIDAINGKFQFKPSNDPDIYNGRPGHYDLFFNVNNKLYSNITSTIQGEQFDRYRITHVSKTIDGGIGSLGTKPKWIYTASTPASVTGFYNAENTAGSYFQITNYFGAPIKNLPVRVGGNDIITDVSNLKTDDDGVVFIQRSVKFTGTDVNHNMNILLGIEGVAGKYRDNSLELTQNVQRIATGNEKIWIKSSAHGTVFDKNTYTAPNGISITAKGGACSFVGIVTAKFYDKDGKFISEGSHKMAAKEEKSINVPKNAATVIYTLDINEDGKAAKVVNSQPIPVGEAAVFFEGALLTENGHIASRNLNGVEILRKDFKL